MHFLRQDAQRYHKLLTSFDPAAMQVLMDYSWPGNVRELSHAVERFLDRLFPFRGRRAAVGQRQLNVFVHGQVANQIEGLEDETNLAVAYARAFRQAELGHGLPIQHVLALSGRIQQAENRKQRGLPAAGGAGNGEILALADVQVDACQSVRFHFVREEDHLHPLKPD